MVRARRWDVGGSHVRTGQNCGFTHGEFVICLLRLADVGTVIHCRLFRFLFSFAVDCGWRTPL